MVVIGGIPGIITIALEAYAETQTAPACWQEGHTLCTWGTCELVSMGQSHVRRETYSIAQGIHDYYGECR